uniref:Copper transport protein ATOX1 n=1 Tax=Rhodnius prolixus TaxID=13249 RepID=T1HVL3_RHOPR
MTCSGCCSAVSKVLERFKGKGVTDFTVDLDKQTVNVRTTMQKDDVEQILKKTGKKVVPH